MGEKETEPFQFTFNGFLNVAFRGSRVTSDAGLILVRELDERLGLEAIIAEHLGDSRHGLNTQFSLSDLLRQSIYSRLAGYEGLNDARRLSTDPTFRLMGSAKRWDRSAALTSTLHWFETDGLLLRRVICRGGCSGRCSARFGRCPCRPADGRRRSWCTAGPRKDAGWERCPERRLLGVSCGRPIVVKIGNVSWEASASPTVDARFREGEVAVLEHAMGARHPRTLGWVQTTALAMGGSNQSLFLIGALIVGQGAIPGQGTAAIPLLALGLLLSWAALPGWTD